jgi:hypothetical protein
MCQWLRYSCRRVPGTHSGCAVVSTGLRRNTAAMLELRCCCRGLRNGMDGSARWTMNAACKRTASYGGRRELGRIASLWPWAFRSTSACQAGLTA